MAHKKSTDCPFGSSAGQSAQHERSSALPDRQWGLWCEQLKAISRRIALKSVSLSPFLAIVAVGLAFSSLIHVHRASGSEAKLAINYRLDSQDTIRLKIVEWRPSLDQVYEWKTFNDEYTVDHDGLISLPILGDIDARGKSSRELSDSIANVMRQRVGNVDLASVSVQVVKYRPFYVLGKVQKPGDFNYRPGLTVLQAVSLAGGLLRYEGLELARDLVRDLVLNQGESATLRVKRRSILAKRLRLEADLAGSSKIEFPPDEFDTTSSAIKALMRQEQDILVAERLSYESRVSSARARLTNLETEMATLTAQLANDQKIEALASAQFATITEMHDRKLISGSRRFTFLRGVYEVKNIVQRLIATRIKLRDDIDKLRSSIDEMQRSRQLELLTAIGAAETELKEVSARLSTAQRLAVNAYNLLPATIVETNVKPVYTIVRGAGQGSERLRVHETFLVQPGDVIEVDIDLSDRLATVGHDITSGRQ